MKTNQQIYNGLSIEEKVKFVASSLNHFSFKTDEHDMLVSWLLHKLQTIEIPKEESDAVKWLLKTAIDHHPEEV